MLSESISSSALTILNHKDGRPNATFLRHLVHYDPIKKSSTIITSVLIVIILLGHHKNMYHNVAPISMTYILVVQF